MAEFERELIRERTQAGLKAARARGRQGGRPRKVTLEALILAQAALSNPQAVVLQVAKNLGMSRNVLYMYLNGDGTLKAAGQKLFEVSQ